jgi:integrase
MVALFNIAMKDDIVNKNYASLIELPKSEPESTRTAFTDEQLEKIKEHQNVPYADVVLFMCYTGWRPTEMCLLTPADVDKTNWVITGGIKTHAGKNRKVPIHSSIQPIVSNWLDKRRKTLFSDEKGKKLNKDTWATRFHNVMKAIFNDEEIIPYTTRHTCASILHAAGVDGVNIAKIMGHKDYEITANVYTHVQLEELKQAVNKLS